MTTVVQKGNKRNASQIITRRNRWGLLFCLPAVLYLLVVLYLPILFGFWLSFHKWNPIADLSTAERIGLANYRFLLTIDQRFFPALKNSCMLALAAMASNLVLGMAFALLMNSPRVRGLKVWRIALFLPMATSPVVIAKIWTILYNKDAGLLNEAFNAFGLPSQGWLTNPSTALLSIALMGAYQYTGYYALIFLAGLQGVPQQLVDAARVDGASGWRVFWHVTLPLLRPVMAFVVVISTIMGLQVFDLVYASTNGGPAESTNTIVLLMYRNVFTFGRAGMGSAMAFLLFGIVLVLAVFQMRLLRQEDW